MYLSRIDPRPGAASSPDFWASLGDAYALHQRLWPLFADRPDRRRDFLFRLDDGFGRTRVYALSERTPQKDHPLWRVASKAFRPALARGDRLRFSLRANPTVKRDGKRHDVVMEARRKLIEAGTAKQELPPRSELAQEAAGRWLTERAGRWGFTLEGAPLRVDGYQLHAIAGKGSKARFATCDFEGVLRVEDAETFLHQLGQGFGPAKGFGCGLMLLARAGRSS